MQKWFANLLTSFSLQTKLDRRPRRFRRMHSESLENRNLLTAFVGGHAYDTIQEAIDAAAANPGDDLVEIEPGTYFENLQIDDPSGALTLRGLGKGEVEIQPAGAFGANVIDVTLTNPVSIERLKVSMGVHGIFASGFVSPANPLAAGELQLVNVAADGNAEDGVHVQDAASVNIRSSSFSANVGQGLELLNAGNVHFRAVGSTHNDLGLLVDGCASLTVSGGEFSDNANHGVLLSDCAGNVTFDSVTANDNDANNDGVGDGLMAVDGGDVDDLAIGGSLTISNSVFSDTDVQEDVKHQENGIRVLRGGGRGGIGGDLQITDTLVWGHDSDGVRILYARGNALVRKSTIFSNRDRGLSLARMGDVQIESVAADFNGLQGLDLDVVNNVLISSVQFNNNGDDGIDIDLAAGVRISGARVLDNGDNGIELEHIEDVRIDSANSNRNGTGLFVDDASSLRVSNCEFAENRNHGIQVRDIGGDLDLFDTQSSDNDADGDGIGDGLNATAADQLYAIGGDLIIVRTNFSDTDGPSTAKQQEFGVNIPIAPAPSGQGSVGGVGGDISLLRVRAVANDADGISIVRGGGEATVNRSEFSENRGRGLRLARLGAIEIQDVMANHNSLEGIDLDVVGDVAIAMSEVKDNGGDGIDIDFSGAVVMASTIASHNGDNGIELESVGATDIRRSVSSENAANGLLIAEAPALRVSQSNFRFNAQDGIHVVDSGASSWRFVYAESNGEEGLEAINSGPVSIVGGNIDPIVIA